MKLVLMEFLSLDGVYQGPGGPDEDTTDGFTRGGWFVPFIDDALMRSVTAWVAEADGFLFGRRTYESFARDWPKMDDPNDLVASKLNGAPKYVASNSLEQAAWAPSTILSGDILGSVAQLKARPGRELQIHGSGRLAYSLLAAGLVDECRLMVAPVVLGQGRKLFREGGQPLGFKPVKTEMTPAGLTIQVYEKAGTPTFATYGPS
ncbi:dihydrofolate reductase family protein [Labrys sp. KNU-23]|uniref:dihydrofolate reductase family protein n=1 Tax=Labrys sp. KNU-23 TaxID=2789216 RepID=UPI0011EDCED2|nr:dihydrofolate reductase family protein [Labrys sp. KNU-23]QEN85458.1 dihydrofolate reductase family protein [Labrys sp. KNU-23]